MKLLSIFARIFRPTDEDAILDHVPVQSNTHKRHARKLKAALARHGKPFHTQTNKEREAAASDLLVKLNEKSAPKSQIIVAGNVTTLPKKASA